MFFSARARLFIHLKDSLRYDEWGDQKGNMGRRHGLRCRWGENFHTVVERVFGACVVRAAPGVNCFSQGVVREKIVSARGPANRPGFFQRHGRGLFRLGVHLFRRKWFAICYALRGWFCRLGPHFRRALSRCSWSDFIFRPDLEENSICMG